jgi:hypothetical protein
VSDVLRQRADVWVFHATRARLLGFVMQKEITMEFLKATADTSKMSIEKTLEGAFRLRVAAFQNNETGLVHNMLVRAGCNGGVLHRLKARVDSNEMAFLAGEFDFVSEANAHAAAANLATDFPLLAASEAKAELAELTGGSYDYAPVMEANPEAGLLTVDLPLEVDAGGIAPVARVLKLAAAHGADIREMRLVGAPTKPNGLRTVVQGWAKCYWTDAHGMYLISSELTQYAEQLNSYWSMAARKFLPLGTEPAHRADIAVCLRWADRGAY